MGGTIEYDYQFKDGVALGKVDPPGPKWLIETFGIESVAEPVVIEIEAKSLDEPVLVAIKTLRSLWGIRVIKRLGSEADDQATRRLRDAVGQVEVREYAM